MFSLVRSLGISDFLQSLKCFFAREIDPSVEFVDFIVCPSFNDLHTLVSNLEPYPFKPLPRIKNLDSDIRRLQKGGVLTIGSIYEFVKICDCFYEWKQDTLFLGNYLSDYFGRILVPDSILGLCKLFSDGGEVKEGVDPDLDSLRVALGRKKSKMHGVLADVLHSAVMQEYLVDRQIHYVDGRYTILVRHGFNRVLKARVVARSGNNHLYIIPAVADSLWADLNDLENSIEARIYFLSKKFSSILRDEIRFISFINREFDFLDSAVARLEFARTHGLEFVKPYTASGYKRSHHVSKDFRVCEYSHPALHDPKPITCNFGSQLLLVTGVNAGGKTMLLKSMLSVAFCAKFFIPMKINASKSVVPHFRHIAAILQDPQDTKNDISTFSGRVSEFSRLIGVDDLLLGIDEIEMGTDSNEAASLYKVLLDHMLDNNVKILVTTHHKRLAILMSSDPRVGLVSAVYNVGTSTPSYEFTDGIGKSYAFEIANKFGIPSNLIRKAIELHGREKEKLDSLIEKSVEQINMNKQIYSDVEQLRGELSRKSASFDLEMDRLRAKFHQDSLDLKRRYNSSIKELKMLAKKSSSVDIRDVHRAINRARNDSSLDINIKPSVSIPVTNEGGEYSVGQFVMYKQRRAKLITRNKDSFVIECDNGIKISNVKIHDIRLCPDSKNRGFAVNVDCQYVGSVSASHKLDLHGYTREDAIEALENFISSALLARFEELIVIHGIGNKILKRSIENYLSNNKFVRHFTDAPVNMGGFGAKLVYL